MKGASSPETFRSSKKRKVMDDVDNDDYTPELSLESIMGEIRDLKKSNKRIEDLLTTLVGKTKSKDDVDSDDKEEEQISEGDEKEEEQQVSEEDEETEEKTADDGDDGTDEGEDANEQEEAESSNEGSDEEEETEAIEDDNSLDEDLSPVWLKKFEQVCAFKEEHGHCNITSSGPNADLGRWIIRQRSEHKLGKRTFSAAKIAKLDTIDFNWGPQTTPQKRRSRRR